MPEINEPSRLRVSAQLVDARGRACPQPIIDVAHALKHHAEVELWADDPAARADLEAFAQVSGHRLIALVPARVLQAVLIRKDVT